MMGYACCAQRVRACRGQVRTPECGTSPRAHERSGGEADGLVLRQPARRWCCTETLREAAWRRHPAFPGVSTASPWHKILVPFDLYRCGSGASGGGSSGASGRGRGGGGERIIVRLRSL